MYRIGVDIGGTFTDVIAIADDGTVLEAKVPSIREHPEQALVAALRDVSDQLGHSQLGQLLRDTRIVIQGTTVAINAVLQSTGARTGLLCTRGFRDVLAIRLGYKEERYIFPYAPPPELVPRQLRLPVTERVDKDGRVRAPLVEADVESAALAFEAAGVEAVAICFLWSFSNPVHERRAQEILQSALPHVFVTTSTEVLPRIREYNRTSTTVLNAYVGPVVDNYVTRTETTLRELGFEGRIRYMQSNGGLAEAPEIKQRPVMLLVSGPAAAPAAGLHFASLAGRNFITVDAGGTSFDAALVRDGRADMRSVTDIDRYRVAAPLIDVNTIGSGGGSIASIDQGLLKVGPESAEADPGPACYARGGTRPTVTDAYVETGLLNPTELLGGRFKINAELATRTIEAAIATPVGLAADEVAAGIAEVVTRNMADAIREITVRRGHDPRDYTLVVGGGAGGLNAAQLADELGIKKIVVPRIASEFCAFGAVVADVRHDYSRSYVGDTRKVDFNDVAQVLWDLEAAGQRALREEGVEEDAMTFQRSLDLRYKDQVWEVSVEISELDLASDPDRVRDEVEQRFHQRHHALYDFSQPGYPCELISATLTALGASAVARFPSIDASPNSAPEPVATRVAQFKRATVPATTPIYAGATFRSESTISGPAIVEEPNTTIVVPPGWRVRFHPQEQAYVLEADPSDG